MHVSRTRQWIRKVVEGLDAHVDPETCARILEACGRQCAPDGLIEKARRIFESSEDIGGFLARLGEVFEAVQVEDGKVYVVYPECYCEQIKGIPSADVPNAYCDCSVGWVKELFERATGRKVSVKRISSVVAGDPECRFQVDLG
jgi:predicted hydrocarbon binding protein